MSLRWTRWAAAAYLLFFAAAVTWPGILPFNRVEPRIFGMPFVMTTVVMRFTRVILIVVGTMMVMVMVRSLPRS